MQLDLGDAGVCPEKLTRPGGCIFILGALGFPAAGGVGDCSLTTHEAMKAGAAEGADPRDWLPKERDSLPILSYTS